MLQEPMGADPLRVNVICPIEDSKRSPRSV
jgi:hypothetical protein